MAKLMLSSEGRLLEEISLDKDSMTIGRKKSNEIHIDSMAVSGKHARFVKIGDSYFIEDLGSTNGTFVNAEKITQAAITENDVITLGTFTLKLSIPEEKTAAGINGHSKFNGAKHMSAHLEIIEGAESEDKVIPITGKMTTIGKPGVHVAAISQHSDGFYFAHVDGGDADATSILNNNPVDSKSVQLQDNDVLEVAGVKMTFHSK
ncbi:MAG: FHA domain-containing protein [Thiotrichales bacterium]